MKRIQWMLTAALGLAAVVGAEQPSASSKVIASPTSPLKGLGGRVFMELDEALELAFPKFTVKRSTEYLTKDQKARVKELSGSPIVSGIIYPYRATKKDHKTGEEVLVATAYFETHRVRSLRETMMFVVSPKGKILRAEVLAFYEPLDYMPNKRFYAQFNGHVLGDELRTKRGIKTVTGCTLSVNASTKAARRILAIHQVLAELASPPAEGGSGPTKG